MATYLITHEVDDVDHWWARRSARRSSDRWASPFAPSAIPAGSNKVGLIAEIPDIAAFQEFMQSDAAAEAIRHDGVRAETIILLEGS